MPNEKQIRLINLLLKKTDAGEVRWEATANEGIYQAAFPTYGVQIERIFDSWQNEVKGYSLLVLNRDGTAVDEMSDSSFTENQFGRSPFLQLQDLFQGAKRTALGADKALEDLLKDLGG